MLNSGPFGGHYTRGNYKFVKDTLCIDTGKASTLSATGRFVLRMNNRKEKYFDPITVDSSSRLSLFVRKDILTNR
jgi:hypothetical protein